MADRADNIDRGFRDVRARVASLHLASWREVEPLLMVRASCISGGQNTRQLGSGISLRIVLPLAACNVGDALDAAIDLSALPTHEWGVSSDRIWAAAAANTRRLVKPTVRALAVGGFLVVLFVGDRSTSGVGIDINYFARASADPTLATLNQQTGWWSLLSERAAVLLVETDTAAVGNSHVECRDIECRDIECRDIERRDIDCGASDCGTVGRKAVGERAARLVVELRRRTDHPLRMNLLMADRP